SFLMLRQFERLGCIPQPLTSHCTTHLFQCPMGNAGFPVHSYQVRPSRLLHWLSRFLLRLSSHPVRARATWNDIKNRLLGHWGSSPGLSFMYVHLSRIIRKYDLNMIFIAGPGHGAPGVLGPTYLEGTYSEIYAEKSQDVLGLREF